MTFDFDREIPRSGTACEKYDGAAERFGGHAVLPMWVADMDFAAPEAVVKALSARAAHPIYGYSIYPDSMYEAFISWMKRRHGWEVRREWLLICPGVVTAMHAAVLAFATPDQEVIIQSPVYAPFFSCVTTTGRRLSVNPLKLENGRYVIDFHHLEQCAAGGAKLLMFCSPHNPVGRVWSRTELERLFTFAKRNGMTIFSDEIHADLVYPGYRHIPTGTLAGADDIVVTAIAPSKTFNIPGLGLSVLVAPNPANREAMRKVLGQLHIGSANPFSVVAFEAAYREGEVWLDHLMAYLRETRDLVREYLAAEIPRITMVEPEGTYLLWLDCRKLGMDDGELKRFFIEKAGVGLIPGPVFGPDGSGFMRMNIAAPRHVVCHAMDRIKAALASL